MLHKFYSLKSIVSFVLVLVVTTYTKNFKGSKKREKKCFCTSKKCFFNSKHNTFPLAVMSHVTKNCDEIQTSVYKGWQSP